MVKAAAVLLCSTAPTNNTYAYTADNIKWFYDHIMYFYRYINIVYIFIFGELFYKKINSFKL